MRPTRDGAAAVVCAVALSASGVWTGDRALLLLAAAVWAVLLLAPVLGWWNLRGVTVRRVLPDELLAASEARGRLLVRCGRRGLPAADVHLVDVGGGASGRVAQVPAGETRSVAVAWRFAHRGPAELTAIALSSTFPFGLLRHTARLPLPAVLLVYPRSLPGGARGGARHAVGPCDTDRAGGTGELVGLRPYLAGDPPRRVHWPATARLGQVVVVDRAEGTARAVEVVVQEAAGSPAFESALGRAAGQIGRACAAGLPVGLRVSGRTVPPGTGDHHRRALLDALAQQPRASL